MKLSLLSLSIFGLSSLQSFAETVPKLAESQAKWVKHYEKQKPPKPAEMLLNTDKEPSLEEGFVSLFNGKDLNDWVSYGGKHLFEMKEGNIIEGTCVKKQASAYLSTKKSYSDFIFTCDLKWLEDMNTGFLFRSKAFPKTKKGKKFMEARGPQAEMEGFSKPDRGWSGGIYRQSCGGWTYPLWLEQHEQARGAVKKDDWNRLTIYAKGETVKTWVNGIPAAHWKDTEFKEGFFSLQVHSGSGGKVQFRNPKVKELKN